jgi:NIMA (never in mitosis gene a)-related kinase
MKKVKMGKLTEKEKQNALNEIRILASINNINVIGYKEAFFENLTGHLCIVMEMADDGDVLQRIEKLKKNKTKFSEKDIWHYAIQMVRGLKALHDLNIVHRDIKCANLFLTTDKVVKLGDLNVSKLAKNNGLLHTQTGTPYYACPEVWKDQPYDNKSDIWSLGCVVYEMATLVPPFRATSMKGLSQKVCKGIYDPIPSHFSSEFNQLIRSCLQVKPSQRPSCDRLLEMPGIQNNISEKLELLSQQGDNTESLLKTIRCPRNLGNITERLPKPQYAPKLGQRSSSLSIDVNAISTPVDYESKPPRTPKENEK